jgi:NifB/MoaA-like Fe-S oxidoreductase
VTADEPARRDPASPGLPVAVVEDAAARAGLEPGDSIVRLNGAAPVDVLDLELAAADDVIWLTVLRDGHPLDLAIEPREGEWHGISLGHDGLGAAPKVCRNACRFCFVDQVPAGLRASLSVKDDDYRLSVLDGNFITLSNLADADLARIEDLRLSPLYVSMHAWDDEARVRLMGRAARGTRAALERLAAAGLELHLQVVLCPGWNDGDVLGGTIAGAASLESVRDVGIVPVSLAAEGELRRVSAADAEALLAAVEKWQARFSRERGAAFVHAADEFSLLCGRMPPASDAPEQYENGVGMSAALLQEARELAQGWADSGEGAHDGEEAGANEESGFGATGRPRREVLQLRLLTGTLAMPVITEVAGALQDALGIPVRPLAVHNALFGPHVTVTGLLGGREMLQALRDEPLADGEWLVAPRSFLPAGLGRTLDDIGEAELAAACGGRLVLAGSLLEAFATLSG